MSISTTLGALIGAGTGRAAAYGKHVALASGSHAANVAVASYDAHRAAYDATDARLAERRAELAAERAGVQAVPVVRRSRKLAA